MSQPLGPTKPTIGRIVHVEIAGLPVTVPAIVTAVTSSDGHIMATAFVPGSPTLPLTEVEHVEPTPGERAPAGSWHWPPVVR